MKVQRKVVGVVKVTEKLMEIPPPDYHDQINVHLYDCALSISIFLLIFRIGFASKRETKAVSNSMFSESHEEYSSTKQLLYIKKELYNFHFC